MRVGYRLTLAPGVYVVTGPIKVSGSATLSGSGVTIYLACDTYPTNCTNGGSDNCGSLTATGGQTTLSAPSSGTYSGVAVLADPGCMGTNAVNGGGLMVTGAFDTPAMTLLIETPNQAVLNSVVVVDNVSVSASATLSVSGSGGGGARGLSV